MKKSYCFLQANMGIIIGTIVFFFSYIFHVNQFINLKTIIVMTIICFYIYRIVFEYQRITLILARCVKLKINNEEIIDIFDIQVLLSSSVLGFVLFLESVVFGIVAGYFLRINVFYLLIVLVVKYLVLAWIPIPIPFTIFFQLIDKEIVKAGRELMILGKIKSMVILVSTYRKMPHNKTYEDWAFKEHGNVLLAQK